MDLTDKQEKFAQGIAKGLTQADAYREAYDCEDMVDNTVYKEACLLMNNPKITERVKELKERNLEKNYDRDVRYYLEKLEEIRQKAVAEGQYSAAVSAIKEDAKISGVYVEKAEVKNNVEMVKEVTFVVKDVEKS
jgi:hypothetical protein